MTGARDFRALAAEPRPERHLSALAPWVHEAGNPYFDWLLGSAARAGVEAWMRSPGSEIALRRVVGLFEDGEPIGGFVGLGGADLARCLRADSLTALRVAGRDHRRELLRRARAVAALRRSVEPDEWFLSKLGVLEPYRRAGRGRALLETFLERGSAAGFERFRLDVWAEDEHTVSMYRSAGFETVQESTSDELGRTLLAMRRTGAVSGSRRPQLAR